MEPPLWRRKKGAPVWFGYAQNEPFWSLAPQFSLIKGPPRVDPKNVVLSLPESDCADVDAPWLYRGVLAQSEQLWPAANVRPVPVDSVKLKCCGFPEDLRRRLADGVGVWIINSPLIPGAGILPVRRTGQAWAASPAMGATSWMHRLSW